MAVPSCRYTASQIQCEPRFDVLVYATAILSCSVFHSMHSGSYAIDQMEQQSSLSSKDHQPVTLEVSLAAGSELLLEHTESDSEPRPAADVDSEPDSDDDGCNLNNRVVEIVGLEIFEHVNGSDTYIRPPCISIVCAFSEGLKAARTPGEASASMVILHPLIKNCRNFH